MAQPLSDARFLVSASDVRTLGTCFAEVAFVGRSNVGKSSLLNALVHQHQLARTSKTPGRTRLINVFLLGQDRWIVDLPGYGYASGPKAETEGWGAMIEGYLLGREMLRMVFVLVDAEVGPTKLDLQMIDWLRAEDLPCRVVATKADKVGPSKALSQRRKVAAAVHLQPNDVAWTSAAKNGGIPELRREVADLLEL